MKFVSADGTHDALRADLVMATVGNGRTYGGGIPICPDADPADGLLDLVLARACKESAPEELRDQVLAKLRAVQAAH